MAKVDIGVLESRELVRVSRGPDICLIGVGCERNEDQRLQNGGARGFGSGAVVAAEVRIGDGDFAAIVHRAGKSHAEARRELRIHDERGACLLLQSIRNRRHGELHALIARAKIEIIAVAVPDGIAAAGPAALSSATATGVASGCAAGRRHRRRCRAGRRHCFGGGGGIHGVAHVDFRNTRARPIGDLGDRGLRAAQIAAMAATM